MMPNDQNPRSTFSIGHVEIDHSGFCRVTFDTNKSDTLDVVCAEELVEAVFAKCRGKKHAILTDSRGAVGTVTPKAREYIRNAPKMVQVRLAVAFVVDSVANRVIANLYIKINRPPNPTKVFNNEEDAVLWLKKYI